MWYPLNQKKPHFGKTDPVNPW